MKNRWICTIILTIILTIQVPITQTQIQPSISLQGYTWDHTTITILIVPQNKQSWWNPSYLNATIRAINMWNNAILNFSSSYSSQFFYLSQIRMVYSISQKFEPGFDIYITWQEEYAGTNTLGTSQPFIQLPCTIINNTIILGTKTKMYVLNEVDMQNIVLHELGHALGLGHSNYANDIMYPKYSPKGNVIALSTLDLYGLSVVFEWLSFYPQMPSICPSKTSLVLPSYIQYEYLPISYKDLPPQTFSLYNTFLNSILRILISPYVIFSLLLLTVLLVVLAIFIRKITGNQIVLKDDNPILSR
ncbi:MAG: matrixin family metalloprotease [Nitrososphaerales archaeon]